jgi:hypothetical protein
LEHETPNNAVKSEVRGCLLRLVFAIGAVAVPPVGLWISLNILEPLGERSEEALLLITALAGISLLALALRGFRWWEQTIFFLVYAGAMGIGLMVEGFGWACSHGHGCL